MQVLLRGFTGYCEIANMVNTEGGNNTPIFFYSGLLSSFNFVVNNKILESSAYNKIRFNDKFDRIGFNVVRDFPNYQLSVSFQCNESLYQFMIRNLSNNMFQKPFYVKLNDRFSDLFYTFQECYVSSFSITVEKDNVMVLSFNFVYFKEDFELQKLQTRYNESFTNGNLSDIKKLMPYYNWKVDFDKYNCKNLLSCAVNFSRQILPKFGCFGQSDNNAIEPLKLHFGLPQITFQLDYLYNNHLLKNNLNNFTDKKSNDCLNETLSIQYSQTTIVFSRCITTVYTPNLVNMDSYNTVSISGKVFGSVSISE